MDEEKAAIRTTVQAEAMPANQMRQLVREAVEGQIPAATLQTLKTTEEYERKQLAWLANLAIPRPK